MEGSSSLVLDGFVRKIPARLATIGRDQCSRMAITFVRPPDIREHMVPNASSEVW